MKLFDLDGKTVLVTGGCGYLGRALSTGLANAQARVCVLGRSREKFDDVFKHSKQRLDFVDCDISDTGSIRAAMSGVAGRYGGLDVLINNAMYSRGQDPLTISDNDWRYSIDGVLDSAYRCIREAVPFFQRQESGNVINISSMYGLISPDFSVYENAPAYLNPPQYGAAKAALLQLTRYFAQYLGPCNIRVNSITPGPFPNAEARRNRAFVTALEKKTCLGRVGRPEDLVGAAVFLSSQASAYMTGQNLVVDGGWTVSR